MSKGFIIGFSAVVLAGVIATAVLFHLYSKLPDPEWAQIKENIRRDFPDVPEVTTADLAESFRSGTRPVIIDARPEKEFSVSHLPGAVRAESVEEVKDITTQDAEIVVYCSVGYRSGDLASKLRASGFSKVSNLQGSIFAWANEGRPLVGADGSPATKVHPFNIHWGKLLDEERRFQIP